MYLYIAPIALVISSYFTPKDLRFFIRLTLLLSIPISLLVFLQYNSPAEAPINVLSDPEDVRFMIGDRVRSTGTFIFTKAQAVFVGVLSACLIPSLLSQRRNRPLNIFVLLIVSCSSFICLALNGNRTAFFLVLSVAVGTGMARISQFKPNIRRLRRTAVALALFGMGISVATLAFYIVFPQTLQALLEKEPPEATVHRLFHEFNDNIPWDLFVQNPLGHGVGTRPSATVGAAPEDNIGTRETQGTERTFFAENEWGRVVYESGMFGIIFLAFRMLVAIWLVLSSWEASRRSNTCFPGAFATLTATLLVTQMITFQETYAYLTWFLVGICSVANRLGEDRAAQYPSLHSQ